ncbi:threonine/serine exporter family protein [Brevibacillus sp. SYP-B805]|uniref:threonine/serine exporter family protein n=1 Tax=Brevibacillus sp. SYP-B805 TaxID=1578199 RepID=UPI0013EAAD19|nr:threonine/serine exporter family protein [Brevibacillus sp. SYP-B805]NGQ96462.1 threonine/serine exporter family protein [Brevibacillus sp. SYP-B805]
MSGDLVMDTCLLAGEIILKNGGETYRAEETMALIARAAGMDNVNSFVTPTCLIMSYRCMDKDYTRMIRTPSRTIDLHKVTLVNDVSRKFVSGKMTLAQAYRKLQEIDRKKPIYPWWLQNLAAGIASGAFIVLIGATWFDILPTVFAGIIVNVSVYYLEAYLRVKIFTEFLAAFLGGMVVFLLYRLFPHLHLDLMIIGTMLPLFPGIAVTNSLRDLMAGDLMAGVSRGVEAVLTALSVAAATAIILSMAR